MVTAVMSSLNTTSNVSERARDSCRPAVPVTDATRLVGQRHDSTRTGRPDTVDHSTTDHPSKSPDALAGSGIRQAVIGMSAEPGDFAGARGPTTAEY